jgi:hypothetical protein
LEEGGDDLQGRPVKGLCADSLGVSRNAPFDQAGEGVDLAVDGEEIVHPGQDQGRPFVFDQLMQGAVDHAEVFQ